MRCFWIFLTLLLASVSGTALADKRLALVIGNSAYLHAPQLANPKNDAGDMAAKLGGFRIEVVVGQDLDLNGMRKSIREFIGRLEGVDVALFFYAGHGLQVNGSNYVVPVDAQLTSYNDLDFEALPIELVLSSMERNAQVNLVFLDACRDNPLAETLSRSMGTRSTAVGRGLAKLETGVGSLIAYATQPGNVALDGAGRNSPFTTALLKHIGVPGRSLTEELIDVRRAVLDATAGKQVPWDSSSLTGPVILAPGHSGGANQQGANVTLQNTPPSGSEQAIELAFWDSIKAERSRSYFESYVSRFPNGLFVDIAKLKIAELESAAKTGDTAKPNATSEAPRRDVEASLGATDGQSPVKPDEANAGSSGAPGHQLTGIELKERLVGRRIVWTSNDGSSSGVTTYGTNGTVVATVDGDQKSYEGTWRIKGNKLCEKFGKEVCAPVSWIAANKYSKKGGTLIVE